MILNSLNNNSSCKTWRWLNPTKTHELWFWMHREMHLAKYHDSTPFKTASHLRYSAPSQIRRSTAWRPKADTTGLHRACHSTTAWYSTAESRQFITCILLGFPETISCSWILEIKYDIRSPRPIHRSHILNYLALHIRFAPRIWNRLENGQVVTLLWKALLVLLPGWW